jgi:hypothetical protein
VSSPLTRLPAPSPLRPAHVFRRSPIAPARIHYTVPARVRNALTLALAVWQKDDDRLGLSGRKARPRLHRGDAGMTAPRVSERKDGGPSLQPTRRRKRSLGITLFVLGASATAAFADSQDGRCREENPDRPQDCRSSEGHWTGGHGVGDGEASKILGAHDNLSLQPAFPMVL